MHATILVQALTVAPIARCTGATHVVLQERKSPIIVAARPLALVFASRMTSVKILMIRVDGLWIAAVVVSSVPIAEKGFHANCVMQAVEAVLSAEERCRLEKRSTPLRYLYVLIVFCFFVDNSVSFIISIFIFIWRRDLRVNHEKSRG
jgi:hypothetical protein